MALFKIIYIFDVIQFFELLKYLQHSKLTFALKFLLLIIF